MRLILIFFVLLPAVWAEQLAIRLVGSAQPNCWDVNDIVAGVTGSAGSDREKALALHRFGMAHLIHFDGPIEERGEYVTDPLKLIGVYGFALCGNNSAAMSALYNAAGLRARTRSMPGHSVPEVWFEGKWNYIDTDMFGYVFLPDGQRIASVDELARDADLFLRQPHPPDPYYPFDEKKAMAAVFRDAAAHKNYHPYANAHMMNLRLRAGEAITFYYRPRDRYLLSQLRNDLGFTYKDYWPTGPVRRGSLAWRDEGPAAYGNALMEYLPDLRSESFRRENPRQSGIAVLQRQESPPLSAAVGGQSASLVLEVNSPWVIAGLQNDLTSFEDNSDAAVVSGLFWRSDGADENRILISTDAGVTWKQVWENRHLGAVPFQVDVTRWVEGRYAYWIKLEWLDRKGTGRVGVERLKLKTWVEISPMALPRLAAGQNKFQLLTGARRTYYHESLWHRGEGLRGQRLDNMTISEKAPYLRPAGDTRPGVLTFPLGPEGTVEEARISIRARALRGSQGVNVVLSLSEDAGASWKELARFAPHPEHDMNHMWFNHAIKGRRLNGVRCLLRIAISGGGLEKVIANSAAHSPPAGASPLRVTHVWREGELHKSATRLLHSAGPYEVETGTRIVNESLQIRAE